MAIVPWSSLPSKARKTYVVCKSNTASGFLAFRCGTWRIIGSCIAEDSEEAWNTVTHTHTTELYVCVSLAFG